MLVFLMSWLKLFNDLLILLSDPRYIFKIKPITSFHQLKAKVELVVKVVCQSDLKMSFFFNLLYKQRCGPILTTLAMLNLYQKSLNF